MVRFSWHKLELEATGTSAVGNFVKDMHTDPTDRAVIKYIHEIAELNNQETDAEYFEILEDVDALREIGITYGQGYFLGKPKPLKDWL
ncbi:MAG TPA: EAL domain-containing protein [Sulfurimonas sp.]|nr:EAL domain-containing protein [Sulfurimonas sp.]HIM75684.1 EAL domain-containing protein [Campylobacterales bacterium]